MPDWDALYEIAASQSGYFTTQQARAAGYSSALLAHYVRTGDDRRILHGIYRVTKIPPGDDEHLVVPWLWSGRLGVFSHETALAGYHLSDGAPGELHLTVPASWRRRRLRIPEGVVLHYADLPEPARGWVGRVPMTTVRRTLEDCARDHVRPDLVVQAVDQAVERGLVDLDDLVEARALAARSGRGR